MIKTGKCFTPGLIDDVPIFVKDCENGAIKVVVGSCTERSLLVLAQDPSVVFDERLVEGDILIDVGGDDFYIDIAATTRLRKEPKTTNTTQFDISRLGWINDRGWCPDTLWYTGESFLANKDKYLYEKQEVFIIGRPEDYYGTKKTSVVKDIMKSKVSHWAAHNILYVARAKEIEDNAWADQKHAAAMKAREIILDEKFYATPVMTILMKSVGFRIGEPHSEAATFRRYRIACGLDKPDDNASDRREGSDISPDMYFYFAGLAALFGPDINTLPKRAGAGPAKSIMLFDHYLPLLSAFIDEWNEDKYIQRTRTTFYRHLANSPFNIKHINNIGQGLKYAGLVDDVHLFTASLRNELYKQWKEVSCGYIKPSQVDYKFAVKEVLLTKI